MKGIFYEFDFFRVLTLNRPRTMSIQEYTERVIEDLLASLPHTEQLSADDRRGIIARYTAVLEGTLSTG
jgi:hypothetical protein